MKKSTKNILAVLSAAFMSFVGILTETSLMKNARKSPYFNAGMDRAKLT